MTKSAPSFSQVLDTTLRTAVRYQGPLFKALIFPFVFMVGLNSLKLFDLPSYVSWVVLLPNLYLFTIFAVSIHRIVLLGPGSVPEWGLWRWTKRETFFVLYSMGISILAFAIMLGMIFTVSLLSPILTTVVWYYAVFAAAVITMSYLMARLSLVLPGRALGHDITYGEAWELSKRHQILMFGVAFVLPMAFGAVTWLMPSFPYDEFVKDILLLISCVLTIGCLSIAYRDIVDFELENQSNDSLEEPAVPATGESG